MCPLDARTVRAFVLGAVVIAILIGVSAYSIGVTSSNEFCMSCHEMRLVAEQGWMQSKHHSNPKGVVANCVDCHLPAEPVAMLWTKTRDGMKDVFVHYFGNSDPESMNWEELAASARSKISDSSCMKCHKNLTPKGAKIKMIIAHREYLRLKNKRCLDCHKQEFHPWYRKYYGKKLANTKEGGM